MKQKVNVILVAALLLLFFWMSFSANQTHSHVFDEIIHVTGGYSYWFIGDYRLNPDNGIFPQRWMTLPLLFSNLRFPALNQQAWQQPDLWAMSYQFFYKTGNNVNRMIFWSRFMICLLGVCLGLVVFIWSHRLFGLAGGMLSLLLYVWCPSVLAHASLATNDLSLTLFLTTSVFCIWMLMYRISAFRLLLSAIAIIGLLLSKASAVVIFPIAGILVIARLFSALPLQVQFGKTTHSLSSVKQKVMAITGSAVIISALFVLAIWMFYGFRFSMFRGDASSEPYWERIVQYTGSSGQFVNTIRKSKVLPEAFLYGLVTQKASIGARRSFLNGAYSAKGFRSFFLYCLLYKTPLALFGLLILSAYALGKFKRSDHRWFEGEDSLLPLIVLLAVYWTFAITASLNIGHRHILPTYPPMFVLAGGAAGWWIRRRRLFSLFVTTLLGLFVAESIFIRPDYLAYFNALAGGSARAHFHLVDSSLDWGQDLPALRNWLAEHPPNRTYLSYFGTADPDYYGVHAIRLPGFPDSEVIVKNRVSMQPGVYCISATMLHSVYNIAIGPWNAVYEKQYQELLKKGDSLPQQQIRLLNHFHLARLCAYLRKREPDGFAGYSILIYNLKEDELNRALYGPAAEMYPDVMVTGMNSRP